MNKILNCGGKTLDLGTPAVMGILNITPDSFYDGGSHVSIDRQLAAVEKMLNDGASIIDIGAVSSRPGAEMTGEEVELRRLMPALKAIVERFPEAILSVDTFRSGVAERAIGAGAGMINDIYGGRFDPEILRVVSSRNIPYVMMHIQGDPANMQLMPYYNDIVTEIKQFFLEQISRFPEKNKQIILDPGFGFGKTVEHNYQLLAGFEEFRGTGYPLMAGMSRKSMINRVLGIKPAEALNGTTVLNTIALIKGADILRVHDVKEAVEAVRLVSRLEG